MGQASEAQETETIIRMAEAGYPGLFRDSRKVAQLTVRLLKKCQYREFFLRYRQPAL